MSSVRVTIDRLVLNGFEPDQRQALVEALQGGLSRALSEPPGGPGGRRARLAPAMSIAPMPLAPGRAGSGKLGAGIARAIAEGLKR